LNGNEVMGLGVKQRMIRRCVSLTLLAVLGVPPIHEAYAEPVDVSRLSKEELGLLEEYRTSYARLRQGYDNLKMEVVWRGASPSLASPDNPTGNGAIRYVYRANGGRFYRMDISRLDLGSEKPLGDLRIRLVRPEGYLDAQTESPDKGLALSEWSTDTREGARLLTTYIFHRAPYAMHVFPMEWFVFDKPEFAEKYWIEKVLPHQDGTDRLVTISSRAIMKRGGMEYAGRFVCLRDRAWALKEYTWGSTNLAASGNNTSVKQARYTYEGDYEGVALLKRLELWRELPPDGKRFDEGVWEVRNVEAGPVPEAEFTADALGLSIGKHRSNWGLRLTIFLAGVVLLTAYFIFRRTGRRKTPAQASRGP